MHLEEVATLESTMILLRMEFIQDLLLLLICGLNKDFFEILNTILGIKMDMDNSI